MMLSRPESRFQTLLELARANTVLANSTSLNRRAENIIIETVVISELKFRDVQRQIFAADFVEASDDAALEARVKLDTNDRLALAWLNVLARGGRGVAWGGKGNVYAVITSILTRPAIVARKRA